MSRVVRVLAALCLAGTMAACQTPPETPPATGATTTLGSTTVTTSGSVRAEAHYVN